MNEAYKYTLSNSLEPKRLEVQSSHKNYSFKTELNDKDIALFANDKVLDAGCGTGELIWHLLQTNEEYTLIDGIDFDDFNLSKARKNLLSRYQDRKNIKFTKSPIEQIKKPDNYYDKIYSRYVFHHMPSFKVKLDAAKELYRVLCPNGHLIIIDFYGLITSIDSKSEELMNYLNTFNQKSEIDLSTGVKLRRILIDAGFEAQKISVDFQSMTFESLSDREFEADQCRQRFDRAKNLFIKIFGSEKEANNFFNLYLSEIKKEETSIYSMKAIVRAQK